jgi:beta-glucosidase
VTNTGPRSGAEVVQVYVGDDEATVRRPPRELRAFAKVVLEPGVSATVRCTLTMRELACWDPVGGRWLAEAGRFTLWAGRSSRDLGSPVSVELTGDWAAPPDAPLTAAQVEVLR